MRKFIEKIQIFFENRSLILSIITILIGIIYIVQLCNLQIVHGQEYRQQSEKKMLRNQTVYATRGDITDRNGIVLATNKYTYNVNLYKVNIDQDQQNKIISRIIDILESNSDKIYSTFPISDDLKSFSFNSDNDEKSFKSSNKFNKDETLSQVIDYYIDKYDLKAYDRTRAIKIVMVRYEASINGYSLFNPAIIAKNISDKSMAQIKETSDLYGIEITTDSTRYYPYGQLAAHTIGYVGKVTSDEYKTLKDQGYDYNSVIGKSGIEKTMEKYLKGVNGENRQEVDSLGVVSSDTRVTDPTPGDSVSLTIDYRLQQVAEQALKDTISDIQKGVNGTEKSSDADAGAVVVLDTVTGEVLASASYPTFDLNWFIDGFTNDEWKQINDSKLTPMVNRTISGHYPPGSTFKMLVAYAGLEDKKITIDEQIKDLGIYPYAQHPKCWIYEDRGATHGLVDVSKAIKVSCNYYFYEVGRRLGIDNIIKSAKMFGLGQKTGIELSDEYAGSISGDGVDPSKWNLGLTLSSAIGQAGNLYTPIQLANYISALSNGGNLNKVTVINSVKDSNQNTISQKEIEDYTNQYTGTKFEPKKLNLNQEYINAIKQGMISSTSEAGGTSYVIFKYSDIQAAGKTGTAQVPNGSNNGVFVGFAPYDNPRIAVVAVIEHGGEGTYTAKVAKPIMEEYFNIKKEDDQNNKGQNISDKSINY